MKPLPSNRYACVLAISWIACSCFLSGCGPAKHIVHGKLTRGGKPLEISSRGRIEMAFYPAEETGPLPLYMYVAVVRDDGSFEIVGPDNKGIPPGKYRVSIKQLDVKPHQSEYSFKTKDKLKGEYAGPSSTITREITGASGEEILVDLENP